MNSENFTVFISTKNIVRKIVVDFDYYNESISAETEERVFKESTDVRQEIEKFYDGNSPKSEKTLSSVSAEILSL